MGGLIPAPVHQSVRTADGSQLVIAGGADVSTLLLGVGGQAEFKPIKVVSNGGIADVGAALSGLLAALKGAGVDTSAVPGWTKGFDGANRAGAGWMVRYNSDNATAPSTGLVGGASYPNALGPIYDPLGRGLSGGLEYWTGGGPSLWGAPKGGAINARTYWQLANTTVQSVVMGTVGWTLETGDIISFGGWQPNGWKPPLPNYYMGTEVYDTSSGSVVVLDRDYQP